MQWCDILTCVNRCHNTLDDNDRQSVETSEGANYLTNGRQLSNHVQEERHQRHEAEVQHGRGSIALSCPFRQHKAFGTLAADNGSQVSKDQHGQRRCKGVNHDTLHARQRSKLRVREEDTRSES